MTRQPKNINGFPALVPCAFGLSLALFALLLPAAAQAGLKLKDSIKVAGDVITVGDLFRDAGKAGDIAIFRAPSPGKSGVVSAARLKMAMRGHGLQWDNTYRLREVVISRPGRTVARRQIAKAIIDRLTEAQGPGADIEYDVALSNRTKTFYVPATAAADVAVLHINHNPVTGIFSAVIAAPAGNPKARRRKVTGTAMEVLAIPVLKRPKARGELISRSDIEIRRFPKRTVSGRTITDDALIAGMSARRSLRAGRPLAGGDVERPKVVKRNSIITVKFQTGSLLLTARGRALADGAVGDVIDVLNAKSNRKVLGTVTGPDTVTVAGSLNQRQAAVPASSRSN